MKIKIHSVCDEFDPLTEDEQKRLRKSLKKHGCKQPILIWKDRSGTSYLMDGRHRKALCDELQIASPPVTFFEGSEEDAKALARSLNEDRRHRTPTEKALAAARSANAGEGRPKITGSAEPVSIAAAAEAHGASVAGTKRAAVVLAQGTEELVNAVEAEEISLRDAAAVAKEPPEVQREAVKAVKKGKAKTAAKAVKAPKQGHVIFDDRKIKDEIGKLARLFNDRANAFGAQKSKEYADVRKGMEVLIAAWDRWQLSQEKSNVA